MSGFAADIIGMIGTVIFIVAYGYATFSPAMNKLWFNIANLVGAALLLVSLAVHFNLASFVLEAAWALIAASGLASEMRRRMRMRR